MIQTASLPKDEELFLSLRELYESYGYTRYSMQKFEEYSLYLDHKNFLTSRSVLTFTEPSGRLMALRPDVTLSIVKNTRADRDFTEKLYYRENVYRLDPHSKSYKEIGQIGVETIGDLDVFETSEIVTLAAKTLSSVDSRFVLSISHTGFFAGILKLASVNDEDDRRLVEVCLRSANTHELSAFLASHGVGEDKISVISRILLSNDSFLERLALARQLAVVPEIATAVAELEEVYHEISAHEYDRSVCLDFTVQNDLDYYCGLIFQGFVPACPRAVLTGGRYDKLVHRFGRCFGAMGFALCLGEIVSCYPSRGDYDFDILLIYNEATDRGLLSAKARELREAGNRVRIAKSVPGQLKFRETVSI